MLSKAVLNENQSYGAGYTFVSQEILDEIEAKYSWISQPIACASEYVRKMPFLIL